MKFREFRFDNLHKQYLYFPEEQTPGVPKETGENAGENIGEETEMWIGEGEVERSEGDLVYCYYRMTGDGELAGLYLGHICIEQHRIWLLSRAGGDEVTPMLLTSRELSERTCIPLSRSSIDTSSFSWAEEIADAEDPISPSLKPVAISTVCGICTHHYGRGGWRCCDAFPRGIPTDIWNCGVPPILYCGRGHRYVKKETRLFIEVFDVASERVVYRYSARGNPFSPEDIRETTELGKFCFEAFREMMQEWRDHLSEVTREMLHARDTDGAFAIEISAINVAMTVNRMNEREIYRVVDEFPEYPN